ncbi:MAG TPA: hypothetical protein VGL93_10475 [Streptosporangiaceae bacterium]|jgi:hypothetical protein
MAANAPISDAERARIIDLARSGMSRAAVGREVGRAASTIGKICAREGIEFDRAPTAAATSAKREDNRAKRADLESLLLDDALRMRAQLWQPSKVWAFGGKENTYEEHAVDEPPFADKRLIMSAVGTAIDKALKLAQVDADDGADDAASMIGRLAEGLNAAYAQMVGDDAGDA